MYYIHSHSPTPGPTCSDSAAETERHSNVGFPLNERKNIPKEIHAEFDEAAESISDTPKRDTFCSRLIDDITGLCGCRPSFQVTDGPTGIIDIPASFSPRGLLPIAGKVLMLGIGGATLYLSLDQFGVRVFWLAYLTDWNVAVSCLYLLISFFNSVVPVEGPPVDETRVNFRVKVTWILFTLSANVGLLVTIAFWVMMHDYDDGDVYVADVATHGILTWAVLMDGLVINAIPVRLRHYFEVVLPFGLAYVLWTALHYLLKVGNPDRTDNDPETNDDLIYEFLDWKNEPIYAITMAAILLFALMPILQLVIWIFTGCRRRYVRIADSDTMSCAEMSNAHAPA